MLRNAYALPLIFLAFLLPISVHAEAVITGVRVELLKNGVERVRFETRQPITPRKYLAIPNPDRIAIDIPSAKGVGVKLPATYKGKLLKSIRFGQFDPQTSRIVLDLNEPASVRTITDSAPLVVELTPGIPPPDGAWSAKKSDVDHSFSSPRLGGGPTQSEDSPSYASHPGSPPPNLPPMGGGANKKPLIAIDAGHGGQDPGATGIHATLEREVTLNFAQNLAKALLKTGRYRVKLTRDDDTYILLHERVNIARKAKADLLISLHADSNPKPEAKGLSLYTLSATASDDEAAALAERENKSDIITGLDLNTTDADVANILIDLTQRETMNKSTTLADKIVESLSPKITRLPLTHRFAGFRVLKAPDVPSVLIELGFLSNATDERLLLSPDYRDLVTSSVIKGIDRYYAAQ